MNENEIKNKNRKDEFKQFVKDHKKGIILTALVGFCGIKALKKHSNRIKQYEAEDKMLDIFASSLSRLTPKEAVIDEDIFTDLAPELEDMVLKKGLTTGWIERTYDLGDGISKLVEINVTETKD